MKDYAEKNFKIKCDCTQYTEHPSDHDANILVEINNSDPRLDGVYVYTSLRHYKSIWKRLKIAIQYILGTDNTYISHTDTYVSVEYFQETIQEIDKYIKENRKNE